MKEKPKCTPVVMVPNATAKRAGILKPKLVVGLRRKKTGWMLEFNMSMKLVGILVALCFGCVLVL